MAFPFAETAGLVGDLFSGVGAYYGQKSANKATKRLAREQMSFQQASNREQMAFQERMSNTSYQRAVQDMRAAGINPMLAVMQGGLAPPVVLLLPDLLLGWRVRRVQV